jgi:hypothetical protein
MIAEGRPNSSQLRLDLQEEGISDDVGLLGWAERKSRLALPVIRSSPATTHSALGQHFRVMSRHVDGLDIDNSKYQNLNLTEDTRIRIYCGGGDLY